MNIAPAVKTCNRCDRELSTRAFGLRRDRPDGLNMTCRDCLSESRSAEPPEARKARLDRYRTLNRDAILARRAELRRLKKTPEQLAAETERKRLLETTTHYQRHRESILRYQRGWYERNKEKFAKWNRENARKHKQRRADERARRRARQVGAPEVEKIDRASIIARDQSMCHLCGEFVSPGQMTLDHVVALARGGNHTASNLKVAHRSCNSRKGRR